MALPVDGDRTVFAMQRPLPRTSRDHPFNANDAAEHHPAPTEPGARDQLFAQGKTGKPARVASHHLGGDDDVAGFKRWTKAAGNAEADDSADARWIDSRKQCAQLSG